MYPFTRVYANVYSCMCTYAWRGKFDDVLRYSMSVQLDIIGKFICAFPLALTPLTNGLIRYH